MQCLTDLIFACSCRVNKQVHAVCFSVVVLSAVSQIRLSSYLISTAMSDSLSLNTIWLEVMISAKNEHVFIRDSSELTFQIIVNACWASLNVGSKWPIAWNMSRYAPSWRFYFHCGIEETGSPGIIWIVSHQVLRHPSELAIHSMENHLLANAHIAKLNERTQWEVTEMTCLTANETALGILTRQGSRGITIACVLENHIWHSGPSIFTEMTDKMFSTGS